MFLLALLFLLPFTVYRTFKAKGSRGLGLLVGISFGSIMLPASSGIYALAFWLEPFGLLLVFVGLPSVLFHAQPAYEVLRRLGLFTSDQLIQTTGNVLIAVVSGFVWMGFYGLLGLGLDGLATRRRRANNITAP